MSNKENLMQKKISKPEKQEFSEIPISREEVLDDSQLCALRKIIYNIYTVDKEIPTLNKILVAARQQLNYDRSKKLLRKLLKQKLNFKFYMCKNNGQMPFERNKTVVKRINFLRQLQDNENLGQNKRQVVYLDEIILNNGKTDTVGEMWHLFYAGNEKDFIKSAKLLVKAKPRKGKLAQKIKQKMFINWLNDMLIPNLSPNSIIIYDDAPQHNKLKETIPDDFSPTQAIKAWLITHNIKFDNDLHRYELLSLLKKNKPGQENYQADSILQAAGHTVLRVPVYTDLNPMENVLNLVKVKVKENCLLNPETTFEEIINQTLASISNNEWITELQNVKRLAEEYMKTLELHDDETDKLEMNIEEFENDMFSSDTDVSYNTDFSYNASESSDESDSWEDCTDDSDDIDNDNDSYTV